MIIERARTRMRKHDWRFRHAQCIEHRRLAHVTQIDQHAEAVELEHDRLAERGEPIVLGIVRRGIRPLEVPGMRQREVTRAERAIRAQHAEAAIDLAAAFHADQRRDSPALVNAANIRAVRAIANVSG